MKTITNPAYMTLSIHIVACDELKQAASAASGGREGGPVLLQAGAVGFGVEPQ